MHEFTNQSEREEKAAYLEDDLRIKKLKVNYSLNHCYEKLLRFFTNNPGGADGAANWDFDTGGNYQFCTNHYINLTGENVDRCQ